MVKALIVIAVIAIIGTGAYVATKSDDQSPLTTKTDSAETPDTQPKDEGPKQYIDYYDGVLDAVPGEKIVFFHAQWCPQCRQLDSEISAGKLPAKTVIIKTDYDTNQALRQKYGVTLQTTFVKLNGQNELIKKYVAYDEPTLESLKKNIL